MADEENAPGEEEAPEAETPAADDAQPAEEGDAAGEPGGDEEAQETGGEDKADKPEGEEGDEKKPERKSEGKPRKSSGGVRPVFDSKGSLLETQSFVKGKLEEFKQKRAAVAKLISELQGKVKAYKEKENPTEEDIANLKKYHAQFLEKLGEYEEMTRNLEKLMGMEDVSTSKIPLDLPPPGKPVKADTEPQKVDLSSIEDKLPKLIVCGTEIGDGVVPRIIVCEPIRKKDLSPSFDNQPGAKGECGEIKSKLTECITTQEKLAAENKKLAQLRHEQQETLLDMKEMMDNMKQKMMMLEKENQRIKYENMELQKQARGGGGFGPGMGRPCQCPGAGGGGGNPMCKRELYMKYRGRPAEGGSELSAPGVTSAPPEDNMRDLEDELVKMGGDIVTISNELDNMQREKMDLGCFCSRKPVCKRMLPQAGTQTDEDKERELVFESEKDPRYKDLKEQYDRLHKDFKNKVSEVASLRVDLEKTRKELEDLTILHHELEVMHQNEVDQNNSLMMEKNQIQALKEQLVDFEQQANLAKQMHKSSQEEMEEMRTLIEDQATQLDEYRNKYMRTLQIAEELKKENEFKERECADQIAVEIQRVKLEMQEQLEELSPIKDLLKITQQKLKETEQMHGIALETIAEMSQQLEEAKNQIDSMKEKVAAVENHGEIQENLMHSLEVAEKRMTELENENERLKEVVGQLESNQVTQRDQLEEKSHELLQMTAQLETLREESARQVARVKERSEMIRKCLQAQIAEMEREVAQCRAATAFANRERDEIRSKLQMEICLLSENFRESQNRIVQLQQHVNYLSASHPTTLIDLVQ